MNECMNDQVSRASEAVSDGVDDLFDLVVLTTVETRVCFKYYHGATGALRATTASVTVRSGGAAVSFATVQATNLTGLGVNRSPQILSAPFCLPVHLSYIENIGMCVAVFKSWHQVDVDHWSRGSMNLLLVAGGNADGLRT